MFPLVRTKVSAFDLCCSDYYFEGHTSSPGESSSVLGFLEREKAPVPCKDIKDGSKEGMNNRAELSKRLSTKFTGDGVEVYIQAEEG